MFKLNDFLNPENNHKGMAYMRSLQNSFKRNTILPSMEKIKHDNQYECKLTRHNFRKKDLILLFQHIYSKDQMSVSDRNLIRRILLGIFPEELIFSGGKKLIQFTSFHSLKKGQKQQSKDKFYLIISGSVKIDSPFYHKILATGMFFGHLQLLTDCHQQGSFTFKAETDLHLICISSEGFSQQLFAYFDKIFCEKIATIPKVLTQKMEPLLLLLICQKMNKKAFSIGQKTSKKGDPIQQIIFIEQGKLSDNTELEVSENRIKVQNTIGLSEIISGGSKYESSSFSLDEMKVYAVQINEFKKIVGKQIIETMKDQLLLQNIQEACLPANMSRNKTDISNSNSLERFKNVKTEETTVKKFVRIRKVNLPYSKSKHASSFSDARQSTDVSFDSVSKYQASFIFIKNNTTPNSNKKGRLNRSQIILSEQGSPFRSYLQNIEVPSLNKFKQYEMI